MAQPKSSVQFHRPGGLPGVELVSAVYESRAFPSHSHSGYVVGVIEHGAETLTVGRVGHLAEAGTTLLLHPDETHANASVSPHPLGYRVMYIDRAVVLAWLGADPAFESPVHRDPALFNRVRSTHAILRTVSDPLSQEQALAALLAALDTSAAGRGRGAPCAASVTRAKAYIEDRFAAKFSLTELAAQSGSSRFHLLRMFKQATGLTPAAYRTQCRVEAARALLRTRSSIAEIALEVGFADQSHLTRHFQRLVGVSPAHYRAQ